MVVLFYCYCSRGRLTNQGTNLGKVAVFVVVNNNMGIDMREVDRYTGGPFNACWLWGGGVVSITKTPCIVVRGSVEGCHRVVYHRNVQLSNTLPVCLVVETTYAKEFKKTHD